jgi:hypothetical protein
MKNSLIDALESISFYEVLSLVEKIESGELNHKTLSQRIYRANNDTKYLTLKLAQAISKRGIINED